MKKTRMEKLFVITLCGIGAASVLGMVGCGGGQSCEKFDIGCYNQNNATVVGISVPGCGGCLSSGKGCDNALWSQSCKISFGTYPYETEDDEENEDTWEDSEDVATVKFIGFDDNYYGGGCLGFGQVEKSCYTGCFLYDATNWNCLYGNTDSFEKTIGCADGCLGCIDSGGIGEEALKEAERKEGID